MKVSVNFHSNSSYTRNGTPLKIKELDFILDYCSKLDPQAPKGTSGAIYSYVSERQGDVSKTGGVVFIDIDKLPKSQAKQVFERFDELHNRFPALYAIQYSASYYTNKDTTGLHIYSMSPELDEQEYKQTAKLHLYAFAQVVESVLGIDLRNHIDTANTSIYQRFFLHSSPYKKSEYVDLVEFKKADIRQLEKKFGVRIENRKIAAYDAQGRARVPSQASLYEPTYADIPALEVNKSVDIGYASGSIARMLLSFAAYELFGDDKSAREWVDRYFCEKHGSIWQRYTAKSPVSWHVWAWLERNGYVRRKPDPKKDTHHLLQGEYITKYYPEMMQFINAHNRVEIVAPTGVGKTTLINNQLVQELNAVVVVPFNVTRHLYSNCVLVGPGDAVPESPCVMVWDQAVKHWMEIKDRTLIIDEAHCLFLDRTYRDTAVILMNRINEYGTKCVLFTATPTGEAEELGAELWRCTAERRSVYASFVKVDGVGPAVRSTVVNAMREGKPYDRIVLFSDSDARQVWEHIYTSAPGWVSDMAYIRSETKGSPEFIELRDKELLTKKLTICTCVAFNGLNFRNEDEKILVVTAVHPGETTAAELIQEAGRLRNSAVDMVVYYTEPADEKQSLDEKVSDVKRIDELEVKHGLQYSITSYDSKLKDDDYVDALRKIRGYQKEHGRVDVIVEEMKNAGYFVMSFFDMATGDGPKRVSLEKKKKESDELKEMLKNEPIDEMQFDSEIDDQYKIANRNALLNLMDEFGVTQEFCNEYVKVNDNNTLMNTLIDNLRRILRVSSMTEAEWKRYEEMLEEARTDSGISNIKKTQMFSEYNKNKQWRLKYRDKIKELGGVRNFQPVCEDVLKDAVDAYKQICSRRKSSGQMGGKIGGKIGGLKGRPNKRIIVTSIFPLKKMQKFGLQEGDEFESCGTLAAICHVGNDTVSRWMRNGFIAKK